MEEYVQFFSDVKDFKNSSKIELNSKVTNIDLLNYYISIQTPVNRYISALLEKVIDVVKLDKDNAYLYSLDEADFLKELNSSKFKKKINELLEDYKKDQKKALFNSCKVYLLEKYFSKKKISPSLHKM